LDAHRAIKADFVFEGSAMPILIGVTYDLDFTKWRAATLIEAGDDQIGKTIDGRLLRPGKLAVVLSPIFDRFFDGTGTNDGTDLHEDGLRQ
jgi:hypothetical protein